MSAAGDGGGRRPPTGKRKRELKKIEDKFAREVTFSKRRGGLFRKASELSMLCGAEIAIIAYSPHGNPFAFGSPSAASVLGRFCGSACSSEDAGPGAVPIDQKQLSEYGRQDREALSRLDAARKRQEAIRDGKAWRWWEEPLGEDLGAEELEDYIKSVETLMEKVDQRLEVMRGAATAPTPSEGSCGSTVVDPCSDMLEMGRATAAPPATSPTPSEASWSSTVVDPCSGMLEMGRATAGPPAAEISSGDGGNVVVDPSLLDMIEGEGQGEEELFVGGEYDFESLSSLLELDYDIGSMPLWDVGD
ncbi:agamous-like MADS-box protein AGL29 [Punica granatum]|uniref:Agamous-like MADS-box protein AGL29 n=1 Tax=Punica granatum TaxID=22663 RepID=A0A218W7V9_PUNGR|nr:agamous-like MADS-box protein AGL29 [Punica granatum]OWM68558.1 hypothetical protein CDL15_Pgr023523 [Punica granatum]